MICLWTNWHCINNRNRSKILQGCSLHHKCNSIKSEGTDLEMLLIKGYIKDGRSLSETKLLRASRLKLFIKLKASKSLIKLKTIHSLMADSIGSE